MAGNNPNLHCPSCGYDLRVMTAISGEGGGRCPECGEVVEPERWAATKLAWEKRQNLGAAAKAWLMLKTVVLAVRQPQRLSQLLPYGARAGSAAVIAWPSVWVAAALAGVAGYLYADAMRGRTPYWRSATWLCWETGTSEPVATVAAAAIAMLLISRASSEAGMLAVRGSGKEARRRALTVLPFLQATQPVLAVGLLAGVWVLIRFPELTLGFSPFPTGRILKVEVGRELVMAVLTLTVALSGVVVGMLSLLAGVVVVARGLAGATRRRCAAAVVYLVLTATLSLLLTLGLLPFTVGLIKLMRLPWLG